MKLVLVLCGIAILALCVFATRRKSEGGVYRRRFENRYQRDASSDSAVPMTWTPTLGASGELGEHHHSSDAGAHCSHGSDGGGAGCGDGGSS